MTDIAGPWPEGNWLGVFLDRWTELTGGFLQPGRTGRELKVLKGKVEYSKVLAAFERFASSNERKYGTTYFVQHFGDYVSSPVVPPVVVPPQVVLFSGVLTLDQIRELSVR